MEQMNRKKRVRVNSDDSEFNSPDVKKLRENLLDDLVDDSDFSATCHDFDSFMKSFEEEITPATATEVVDLMDESQPELGYLLEASDDDLGLPPSTATAVESELIRVNSDSTELSNELWELSNYDSFELGINDLVDYNNNDSVCEYVVLDGLFDHSDLGFGSADFLWRPETLPAN